MNFLVIDEEHRSQTIIGAEGLEELIDKLTDGERVGYTSTQGDAIGHLRVLVKTDLGGPWPHEEFFHVIVLDTLCPKPHNSCGDTPPSHRGVIPREILEGGYNPPPPGGVLRPATPPAAPPPKRDSRRCRFYNRDTMTCER